MPARCPLIPEAEEIGRDIRQLLYGKRSGMHRIIFDIQERAEEGPHDRVLRVWPGSRERLRVEDLEGEEAERPKQINSFPILPGMLIHVFKPDPLPSPATG